MQVLPNKDEDFEVYCKRIFTKLPTESEKSYIKRTFGKYDNEDDDAFLKRLDTVTKVINNEAFYKPEYRDLTKRYFGVRYAQNKNESREQYLRRILRRRSHETYEIYVRRIKYLQLMFPDLECWPAFEFVTTSEAGYRLKNLLVSHTSFSKTNSLIFICCIRNVS